jgi:DNA-binding SARP family transcriptional activator
VDVRVLGPLRVVVGEREVELQRQKHRALLALLALRAGEVVSVDRLLDELWGERPPPTARNSLQNYVSHVRKLLGADVLVTRPPGYVLEIARDDVDAHRFTRLVEGSQGQAPPERAATLRQALACWRGPALVDVEFEPFALTEAARLEDIRAGAEEELVAAELELGRHAELVPRIEDLVAHNPMRERLRGQLMLALYRSGRQAEALAAYQDARRALIDELGIEPGPALRALEQGILRQDPALAWRGDAADEAPLRPADLRERRATVTVLFAEVTPRDEDDAERTRSLTTRAFHELRAATEYHGGTVERLAGDELMAVFGAPERHEDDALRAARAALQIQRATRASRELEIRIALDTGEVVLPGAAVRTPLTGAPVTLAKRLAEAASPGVVVAGAATMELLHGAVLAEPIDIAVRGRPEPVGAFRIDGVQETARRRRLTRTALVGREPELAQLRSAFADVSASGRTAVVGVVGDAGVGKTRLAVELAESLAPDARVVVGRCVSYGEGATWLPLRELARTVDLQTLPEDVAEPLQALLGGGALSLADAFWAARRFVGSLARDQPALVVLEDVHWAAPTFLDFVEQLAESPTDGPALVLCLARTELGETRPALASVALEPLSKEEARELVDAGAGDEVPLEARRRIAEIAEGNPLFAEQLVAYARERGVEALATVPPTVEALLASRLDRLDAEEHAVLQRAAVVGREFWQASVLHLTPALEVPSVGRHLAELTRMGLIHAARSSSDREDAFRFHHVLIRDVAYASLPKLERADLHEGVAEWLDAQGDADDAIVGFHLEQAYRHRVEVGPEDRHAQRLAIDAGERLGDAGIAAWKRADAPAAVNLLGRATALLPRRHSDRAELMCELAVALRVSGRISEAQATLDVALFDAVAAGDRRAQRRAELERVGIGLIAGDHGGDVVVETSHRAISVFEEARDHRGLGRSWLSLAIVRGSLHCQNREWQEHAARALEHYTAAGWPASACRHEMAAALYNGPTPVPEAVAECRRLIADADRAGKANVMIVLAGLEAMRGRVAAGTRLLEEARGVVEELGLKQTIALAALWMAGEIALAAGSLASAEQCFRETCAAHLAFGNRTPLATTAAELADILYVNGRFDEAEQWVETASASMTPDDASAQFSTRSVRAKLIARGGGVDEALALVDEAVAIAAGTDSLNRHAKVLLDRAEVLVLADSHSAAGRSMEEALRLFETKGNTVATRRARKLLDRLAIA